MQDPAQIINWSDYYSRMTLLEEQLAHDFSISSDVCYIIDAFTSDYQLHLVNYFLRSMAVGVPLVKRHTSSYFDFEYSICEGYQAESWMLSAAQKQEVRSSWEEYRKVVARLQAHGREVYASCLETYSSLEKMTLCEKLCSGDENSILLYVALPGPGLLCAGADLSSGAMAPPQEVEIPFGSDVEEHLAEEGRKQGKTVYLAQNLSKYMGPRQVLMYVVCGLQKERDGEKDQD